MHPAYKARSATSTHQPGQIQIATGLRLIAPDT